MRLRTFLLLICLSPGLVGQSTLEPVRISITTDETSAHNREAVRALRAELTRDGRVAFVSETSRQHFNVVVVAAPISEGGPCRGFVAAMAVTGADRRGRLSIHTSARMDMAVQHMAEKLMREFKQPPALAHKDGAKQ